MTIQQVIQKRLHRHMWRYGGKLMTGTASYRVCLKCGFREEIPVEGLHHDKLREKLLWFLKAPCPPDFCPNRVRVWHLSCLTCPVRRHSANPKGKFRKYQRAILVLESASGRGIVLPKRYRTYGLIFPIDEYGNVAAWKRIVLKIILTVAERIAEC